MLLAAGDATISDNWLKIIIGITAAIVGFILKELADRVRDRKKVKRLSYATSVGSAMTNVPNTFAAKVQVNYAQQPVEGQLYEVTCTVVNAGRLVVKDQYLRFSFPTGTTVLETYTVGSPQPELGVREVELDQPRPTDRRWVIAHIEKHESVDFGFLVVGQEALPPAVHGHNDEGGIELEARRRKAQETNAARSVMMFFVALLMLIFFPPYFNEVTLNPEPGLQSLYPAYGSLIVIPLLFIVGATFWPVAELIAAYLTKENEPNSEVHAVAYENSSIVVGDNNTIRRADPGENSAV